MIQSKLALCCLPYCWYTFAVATRVHFWYNAGPIHYSGESSNNSILFIKVTLIMNSFDYDILVIILFITGFSVVQFGFVNMFNSISSRFVTPTQLFCPTFIYINQHTLQRSWLLHTFNWFSAFYLGLFCCIQFIFHQVFKHHCS